MSVRNLIAALTVLAVAFAGGTALASPSDAPPLKKVQVDKTGNVTKTDAPVKKGDGTKAAPRTLKTRKDAPTRKGDKTLKPTKAGTVTKRPAPEAKRMKTQDIKPDPRVDRGTKPDTGAPADKRDTATKLDKAAGDDPAPATTKVGPESGKRVKTTDGARPAADVAPPAEKRDEQVDPAGPSKRAPK